MAGVEDARRIRIHRQAVILGSRVVIGRDERPLVFPVLLPFRFDCLEVVSALGHRIPRTRWYRLQDRPQTANAASIIAGSAGILHGSKTYILQTDDGQIQNAHSISAGLDYPGVGPQHAHWADEGRVEYCAITDEEALASFHEVTRLEGIIPALESSHATAEARKRASVMGKDKVIVVNLSGRGDKDIDAILARGKRNT